MPSPGLEPDPEHLEDIIWTAAIAALGKVPLSVPGEYRLKDVIRRGVERMVREHRADELGSAEASMTRFVFRMREHAENLDKPHLDDEAVEAALKLCGLWPFC